jgi:hypothetical protein
MAVVRRGRTAIDIGPAAAGGAAGVNAIAQLSAVKGWDTGSLDDVPVVAVGAVERRRATPEELARLNQATAERPVAPGPSMHLLRPAAAVMEESRRRGAERHQEVMAARRAVASPAPTALEEAPMTPAALSAPLPCADCLHAPVCALKATLEDLGPLEPVQVIDRGLTAVATAYRIECDHHLVSLKAVEREPIRAEYPGESWRTAMPDGAREHRQPGRHPAYQGEAAAKAERAAQVIAALARHGGDKRAAAEELGMKLNAFSMVLKFAAQHQPADGASA